MDVFEFLETVEVTTDLAVAPVGVVAEFFSGEDGFEFVGEFAADEGFDVVEQVAGLRWEFVQAVTEDFGGDGVGGGNVFGCDGDHFDDPACRFVGDGFALVLVEECDGVDEGEVFFVVAPGAGGATGEGELVGIGVDDTHGADEPLDVLHEVTGGTGGFLGKDAVEGAGTALLFLDEFSLLLGFIDC